MIIIHGEDSLKSYPRLTSIVDQRRQDGFDVSIHEAGDLDITDLRQFLNSTGLFSTKRCLVLKNLFSGKKSKTKDKIIDLLKKDTSVEIILWEDKNVSSTYLKHFSEAKVETFPINPVIFKFLDSLRPGNTKNIMISWKSLIVDGTEPEFVFAMIVRQIKLLIQIKTGPKYLKLAPYPTRLISQQSQYFSIDKLLDLYQNLFQIDIKIKTGSSVSSLEHLLTNFLHKI